MRKVQLYIGANNETGEVEYSKIHPIIRKTAKGYTITKTEGFWDGFAENSCIVTIFTDTPNEWVEIAKQLCKDLEQYAILVEIDGVGVIVEPE